MTQMHKRLTAGVILIGAGLAAAMMPAAASGPLSCDIRTGTSGGMISLDGVVASDAAASGSYNFRVVGGGTDIEQGGDFSAGAGKATTLGQVMLGKGKYKVDLKVTSKGKTVSCSKRVG